MKVPDKVLKVEVEIKNDEYQTSTLDRDEHVDVDVEDVGTYDKGVEVETEDYFVEQGNVDTDKGFIEVEAETEDDDNNDVLTTKKQLTVIISRREFCLKTIAVSHLIYMTWIYIPKGATELFLFFRFSFL